MQNNIITCAIQQKLSGKQNIFALGIRFKIWKQHKYFLI